MFPFSGEGNFSREREAFSTEMKIGRRKNGEGLSRENFQQVNTVWKIIRRGEGEGFP